MVRQAGSNDNASTGNDAQDQQVITRRVRAWIQNIVIGLRLCPFAEGVVVADTVRYVVSKGSTPTDVVTDVMTEALRLVTTYVHALMRMDAWRERKGHLGGLPALDCFQPSEIVR